MTTDTSENHDVAVAAPDDEASATEKPSQTTIAEGSDEPAEASTDDDQRKRRFHNITWAKIVAFRLLPALSVLLASGAAYLKWVDSTARDSRAAQMESVQAAKETTSAILSYRADFVEQDLNAAQTRLTGQFQDAYTELTHDVVIPGAKQRHITAVAAVPAASSVSATPNHAVVLVFVNQTVTMGNDPPTDTASSVRVTLDKVSDRWLVSAFDPI